MRGGAALAPSVPVGHSDRMSDQPCPGKCNARFHKAWKEYRAALAAYKPLDSAQSRPAEPDLSPRAWGEPVWCAECTTQIRLHLAQLDDLAAIYAQAGDGHRDQPVTQRVGGVAVILSPSEIHDQLAELTSAITGWENTYRQHMGWDSPPPRGDDATVQTACIAWLSRHLDAILASPLAEETGRGILTWRATIAGRAKAGPRTILLPTRCPGRGCGQRLLTWEEGTNRVECKNPACQKIMTKDDYDAEVERELQAHRNLLHGGRACDCVTYRAEQRSLVRSSDGGAGRA